MEALRLQQLINAFSECKYLESKYSRKGRPFGLAIVVDEESRVSGE